MPYRFKAADDRIFNLDFQVKTLANVQLGHAKDFTIQRAGQQYVYFREVELQPGEEYSFVVGLDRYIAVNQYGVLTVQAFFFPELLKQPGSGRISSNVVPIHVRPAIPTEEQRQLLDLDTNEIIQKEILPPDEVVQFTISSRQRDQMARFFLYLDVESLMLQSPEWKRRYDRLPEEGRRQLVAAYRAELSQETIDEDILIKPTEFEILITQYTPTEGTVTVREKFAFSDYTELKEYTYYLERRDRHWMITNYEVMNLGAE